MSEAPNEPQETSSRHQEIRSTANAGAEETAGPGKKELWLSAALNEDQQELEKLSGGVPVHCQFCVGQKFRRSRLRSGDIPQLLLMRYPVRCMRCSQRQTVSFTVAGASIPSFVRHRHRSGSSKNPASTNRTGRKP